MRAHFSLHYSGRNKCFIPNGRPLDTGTGTGGQAQLQRDTKAYRNPSSFILGAPISQHSGLSYPPPGTIFGTRTGELVQLQHSVFGFQVSPPDCCLMPRWAASAHFTKGDSGRSTCLIL